MPRTTLDIDDGVLRALKDRRRNEQRALGVIASELLAQALAAEAAPPGRFTWAAQPMGTPIDLEDKDAVWAELDAR
jgi:plasmid stability protein